MHGRGFTLIELLVALAVTAVVLTSVAPYVSDYMTNMRVRAVADQFRDGLYRAKIEAIKRNTSVEFVPDGAGWSIVLPARGTSTAVTLTQHKPLSAEAKLSVSSSLAQLRFNGAGWVANGASFAADVTVPGGTCKLGGGAIRCLRIAVTGAGDVQVCDPATSGAAASCS